MVSHISFMDSIHEERLVRVVCPPFKERDSWLNKRDSLWTEGIASATAHVEIYNEQSLSYGAKAQRQKTLCSAHFVWHFFLWLRLPSLLLFTEHPSTPTCGKWCPAYLGLTLLQPLAAGNKEIMTPGDYLSNLNNCLKRCFPSCCKMQGCCQMPPPWWVTCTSGTTMQQRIPTYSFPVRHDLLCVSSMGHTWAISGFTQKVQLYTYWKFGEASNGQHCSILLCRAPWNITSLAVINH